MSELDDSKSGGPAEDSAPEGYEDTVVEILSLGDEADAADAGRAASDQVRALLRRSIAIKEQLIAGHAERVVEVAGRTLD